MFRVYGRFRPLNAREKNECADDTILVRHACTDRRVVVNGSPEQSNHSGTQDFSFNLDHVLYEPTTQKEQYELSIMQHVQNLLENTQDANILTYGQTSSEKTWTTDGDFYSRDEKALWLESEEIRCDKDLGILPRILFTLFLNYKSAIRVSYYKIYCEKIYDLLAYDADKNEPRECKFTEINGQISTGVSRYSCADDIGENATVNDCYQQICRLLRKSNKNRHIGFTAMNSKLSRSHTFLEFHCPTTRQNKPSIGTQLTDNRRENLLTVTTSNPKNQNEKTLRIIDLAGSKRATKTLAKNKALAKGININNSFMYLKQMIEIIASHNNKRTQTLPKFREFKLTRINLLVHQRQPGVYRVDSLLFAVHMQLQRDAEHITFRQHGHSY